MFGGMIGAALGLFYKEKKMKDDILIINGKKYVHTPEVKEEKRIEGWVDKKHFINSECTWINSTRVKIEEQTTKFVELKENEIIVSEAELSDAWNRAFPISANGSFEKLCKELFKKDGV